MSAELLIVVVSIGLADSVNPATIGPALLLATASRPKARVAEFAAGYFAVNLAAGAVLALGPGQLLLGLLPRPSANAKHAIELAAGAALIALAAWVLVHRARLARRPLTGTEARKRSGVTFGAALSAIELPTALPYFAAIAAIVGSDAGVASQLLLLALFNVAFLLPVLAILLALQLLGTRADAALGRMRQALERRWPDLVGALLLVVGVALLAFGVGGLV